MWYVTLDIWHMTYDMLHVEGGEHSLKSSDPKLIRFGSEVIKWQIINEGVCRTNLATPGLLNNAAGKNAMNIYLLG